MGFDGVDVLLIALALALAGAAAYARRRSRARPPELPLFDSLVWLDGEARMLEFKLAPDLEGQRDARVIRQATAYRELFDGRRPA